ncbi:hypothetical protein MLD38_018470 [Melastoma candidum]|uniref:Uncharacterized protein n=1 Tax=Melastoma candidum TaxID=119954 RepID=A0ACB9R263_9MYRT|nr:hypothetical protein MLD38_018470 [Melastoma candidum]
MDFPYPQDSGFTQFNSVLTAGLLNPHSPPPQPRSSPTLFEMMANEPEVHPRHGPGNGHLGPGQIQLGPGNVSGRQGESFSVPVLDVTSGTMHRIRELLEERVEGFNDEETGDVRLHLKSKDGGVIVGVSVHREVLVRRSRFFAQRLGSNGHLGNSRRGMANGGGTVVEIEDCEDVEVYLETVRLMYCEDIRRRLMRDAVSRVLDILKVATAIEFDAGVLSCLEYLEAAPWAEDEEEKVASLLSSLCFDGGAAGDVLKRVSLDVSHGADVLNNNDEVLLNLLKVVLEGKDEKARRDMKGLVSKMLHENSSHCDIKKESLYSACGGCLQLLHRHFLQAASSDLKDATQISRQADNLHWLLDILIDRQIAEDFLTTWAAQTELSEAHPKVPAVHRFEISHVTARLFVGIGKGQLLASKDSRCSLLRTWLGPFYNDFGWMKRASKGLDRHLIEDGLSNTILTLPLACQRDIMLTWFDRFLNSGDDCPNIQRGFEIWWRRAFWKRNGEQQLPRSLRITADS